MYKTRSKSKLNFTTVNVIAALFSVLLLVGLFYSHAGAASAAPDIKLKGIDHMSALLSNVTLMVAGILNGDKQAGNSADFWIATVNNLVGSRAYDRSALAVETGSFPVVDTGQTACYDDNGDEISCPEPG